MKKQFILLKHSVMVIAITILVIILSFNARGQDMLNGANNFYQSNLVTVQKVTFKNQYNMQVVGNLFTPKEMGKTTYPAIIVGHPMGAVKEQSANLYATKYD